MEGYTSSYRCSQSPTTRHDAKSTSVGRYTLAALDNNPKNGATNISVTTTSVSVLHGWISRRRAQWVSSPKLPYQITRYWPKVRYPQSGVNAKQSFPRSWKCVLVTMS